MTLRNNSTKGNTPGHASGAASGRAAGSASGHAAGRMPRHASNGAQGSVQSNASNGAQRYASNGASSGASSGAQGYAPSHASNRASNGAQGSVQSNASKGAQRYASNGASNGAQGYVPSRASHGTQRSVPNRAYSGSQSFAQGTSPRQAPSAQYGSAAIANELAHERARKGGKQEKKRKGGAATWVFRISLVVFIGAMLALGVIGFSYFQGVYKASRLSDEVFVADDTRAFFLEDVSIDWDYLRSINPDTVGWIYMPGTVINYPVVQTTNNSKYLKTDFQGETNWAVSYGAIFLDCSCASDFTSQNNFIYGHNMNNGAMFHDVTSLTTRDAFEAHRTVYLFTPQGNYRLRSFALVHVAATDTLVEPYVGSSSAQAKYVQDKMDRSVVVAQDSPAASEIETTFALSTCDNLASDGRYLLFCYIEETTVPGQTAVGEESVVDTSIISDVGKAAEDSINRLDPTNAY